LTTQFRLPAGGSAATMPCDVAGGEVVSGDVQAASKQAIAIAVALPQPLRLMASSPAPQS
jgi:hypothetical protein